jgi:hypothetical protein
VERTVGKSDHIREKNHLNTGWFFYALMDSFPQPSGTHARIMQKGHFFIGIDFGMLTNNLKPIDPGGINNWNLKSGIWNSTI